MYELIVLSSVVKALRSQTDGLEGIGVYRPRRDRHCKRETVPKTDISVWTKVRHCRGPSPCEKVGYGRGANAPNRESGELHDNKRICCFISGCG